MCWSAQQTLTHRASNPLLRRAAAVFMPHSLQVQARHIGTGLTFTELSSLHRALPIR